MRYRVCLSGEIHSDWREQIVQGCEDKGLDILFTSPVTNHELSDAAGDCLGEEFSSF